jgi:predicted TIM-barrel fold metal-dependent hydrolase
MRDYTIGRRAFIKGAGLATLGAAGIIPTQLSEAQEAVPNSSGTERPKLKVPRGACDCHQHIYDVARFTPTAPGAVPNATASDYRLLQKRLGTTRNIVLTPNPYVKDNRVTLDAVAQFGPNSRGVANVDVTITDAELAELNKGGIRGVRFAGVKSASETLKMIQPLAQRVNDLGWHVDLGLRAEQVVDVEDLLMSFPAVLVIDHMGHVPQPLGPDHPCFAVMRRVLDKGRMYVKLSMTSSDSKVGPPTYSDITKLAQAYVKAAPERLVWGTNWPHPNEDTKLDDARVLDLLAEWAPDEKTRHRILVDNAATVYGFPKVS